MNRASLPPLKPSPATEPANPAYFSRRRALIRLGGAGGGVLLGACSHLSSSDSVAAQQSPSNWQPRFRGVSLQKLRWGSGEALLQGFAVRVDLNEPGTSLITTRGNGAAPLETAGETTLAFARRRSTQVAVNACFYKPCCLYFGTEPKDLSGLAIAEGQIVSPWQASYPCALVVSTRGAARILRQPLASPDQIAVAVAGMDLLHQGKPVKAAGGAVHPRTAAGLSADNRYLFLLVLDGRQPQHSRGADLHETAQRLAELGAHEGVNLDGGGSTTLVIQSLDGSQKVVNRPPSPLLRVNGNHLGVKAEPLPSA